MTTANPVRGEVELDLAGTVYPLRPSYEAVVACEKATGLSLTDLALAADRGSLSVEQAGIVVTEMIRAFGKANNIVSAIGVQPEKISRIIFAAGVMAVLPRVAIALLTAATGGVDVSGNPTPIAGTIPPDIGETSQG